MTPCDSCQQPATCNCAGLDVPLLWFCDKHGAEHERTCIHIRRGRSQFTRLAAPIPEDDQP